VGDVGRRTRPGGAGSVGAVKDAGAAQARQRQAKAAGDTDAARPVAPAPEPPAKNGDSPATDADEGSANLAARLVPPPAPAPPAANGDSPAASAETDSAAEAGSAPPAADAGSEPAAKEDSTPPARRTRPGAAGRKRPRRTRRR
jgi:hypothetical protein